MDMSRNSTTAGGMAVPGGTSGGATFDLEASTFLRRKATVGSHGTAVDYAKDERVFHSKDMPGRAREARVQVKQSMADAVNKRVWNTSVQVPRVLDKRTMSNFEFDPSEYDYNFRAEELPQSRPVVKDVFGRTTSLVLDAAKDGHFKRTQELPTHKALLHAPKWQGGCVIPDQEWKAAHVRITAASRTHSKGATKRILEKTGYTDPYSQEVSFMEELRRTRSMLASSHAAEALAETLQEENSPVDAPVDAPMEDPLADIDVGVRMGRPLRTENKSKLVKKYKHEGVYGPIPGDAHAWSCCGAYDARAQGCVFTTLDPDKPCFLGF